MEEKVKEITRNLVGNEDEDTLKDRYLTFYIGGESYAIEIEYVREIIGIQKITSIPNIKSFIKGIINLRGIIIPVVEVRLRFGMKEIDYNDRTCIIVVHVNNTQIGLIVDEVSEVMKIEEDMVFPPPQTGKGSKSRFIKSLGRIDEDVKIMLDLIKLLYDTKDSDTETDGEEKDA